MIPMCQQYMVEKFKFRWVPKNMKYLGIQLSQDLEDLVHLKFKPTLQKIQRNLEKWDGRRLILNNKAPCLNK